MERRCSLCGKFLPMTEEHVPPQSCNNRGRIEKVNLFPIKNSKEPFRNIFISQNGLKFKSLCQKCNNEIMGKLPDIAFKDFYDKVVNLIEKQQKNDFEIKVLDINVRGVIKCILGKMLAMDSCYNGDPLCNEMREFIFYDKIPATAHLYVRYYPFDESFIARNYGVAPDLSNEYCPAGLLSVLNYKPFGFILSETRQNLAMVDLIDVLKNGVNELVFSSTSMSNPKNKSILPQDWLLNPSTGEYVLYLTGNSARAKIIRKL